MATTKLWKTTSNVNQVLEYAINDKKTDLENVLRYARNDEKTKHELFVSGTNCNPNTVYEEMKNTKIRFNKTKGILGFHAFQSFKEGEVTPELAHEIGLQLANKIL